MGVGEPLVSEADMRVVVVGGSGLTGSGLVARPVAAEHETGHPSAEVPVMEVNDATFQG